MKTLACLFVCLIASPLLAQLTPTNSPAYVTVEWNASADPSVVSYRVYYGNASRFYTNVVTVTGTSATISNLVRGVTYYFAATCLAGDGLESEFSNEVSYRPASPAVAPVLRLAISPNGKVLLGSGDPYTPYEIERSADWNGEWAVVGTIQASAGGAFTFSDPSLPPNQAFYRVKQETGQPMTLAGRSVRPDRSQS